MGQRGPKSHADLWDTLQHFRPGIFACKCGQCAGHNTLHVNVALALDEIAEKMDSPPLVVTGCRCPTHNRLTNKDPYSPHCAQNGEKTYAVDLKFANAEQAFQFLKEAVQLCSVIIAGPGKILHIEMHPKAYAAPRFWRKLDIE